MNTPQELPPPTNAELIALTRHLRDEQADIWSIFQRVGFREYMSMDELYFVHKTLPNLSWAFWEAKVHPRFDEFITLGLLERLGDGMLSDADLEGDWVADFIADRRHVPSVEINGLSQTGGSRPIELGWIMALAREIDADPKYWAYFISLTEFQHNNPRERPGPNPIENRLSQFRDKHCLHNRDPTLGIYPLLYGKRSGKIDDITDVEQVKAFLRPRHRTAPSSTGGFNLDIYFEDLDR